MKDNPAVQRFIALVDGWNCAGWGEYLLWETLEGIRDRPFRLMGPLSKKDMDVLRKLRDELKTWPFWDEPTKSWDFVDIEAWRTFAETTGADDIRQLMDHHGTG
jgi:hypothetical protein